MTTKSPKLEQLYIELDVILDTRLATLGMISEEAALSALQTNYHTRLDDRFEGVNFEEYKEKYKKRNIYTLHKSLCTDGLRLIRHLTKELAEQAIVRPYHNGPKVIINHYPYKLSEVERDSIGKAVSVWISNIAPVELIYIPPIDLTPAYCKSLYSIMMMYEYEDWLNMHTAAFQTTRLPEVPLLVPAIYFGKTPTKEELDKLIQEAAHPMQSIQALASPLIELTLIDICYFSVIKKNNTPAA
jgi:hypothetical protein